MSCAVIAPTAGTVTNVIVAEASKDYPPLGYILVDIPEGVSVDAGATWNSTDGFTQVTE